MQTSTKHKPKSCSCNACRQGRKHGRYAQWLRRHEQKAFRRKARETLRRDPLAEVELVLTGGYTD